MFITAHNLGTITLRLTLDEGITCAATLRRTLVAMGYHITDAYNAANDALHCGLVR